MLEQVRIVGTHPVQGYHHVAGHPGGVVGGGGQVDDHIVRLPHAEKLPLKKGQSYNSWFGAPGAPGAPETLKLQVDRRSELVWFAKGNEINISDFCIANTKDIKCQL